MFWQHQTQGRMCLFGGGGVYSLYQQVDHKLGDCPAAVATAITDNCFLQIVRYVNISRKEAMPGKLASARYHRSRPFRHV
jgi:hypothetical protein